MEEEDPSAVEANLRLNPLAMVAASQKKRLKKGVIRVGQSARQSVRTSCVRTVTQSVHTACSSHMHYLILV
jgi:hypothetical protein